MEYAVQQFIRPAGYVESKTYSTEGPKPHYLHYLYHVDESSDEIRLNGDGKGPIYLIADCEFDGTLEEKYVKEDGEWVWKGSAPCDSWIYPEGHLPLAWS